MAELGPVVMLGSLGSPLTHCPVFSLGKYVHPLTKKQTKTLGGANMLAHLRHKMPSGGAVPEWL